jgi:hypothetical protein
MAVGVVADGICIVSVVQLERKAQILRTLQVEIFTLKAESKARFQTLEREEIGSNFV